MKILFIIFFLGFSWGCREPADSPRVRAEKLGKQLRCPVCRGISIADSPSKLAQEMMSVIHQQVQEGKTDEEILGFFEERYGEWALLEPKAEGMSLMVWVLPVVFLLGGGYGIVRTARKQKIRNKGDKGTSKNCPDTRCL